MSSTRLFLVATACAIPLSIAACGGSDAESGQPVPEGTHYEYVVSSVSVPSSSAQVSQFGLDLGSKMSSKQDGAVDNQLGSALNTLSNPPINFKIQDTVTAAVNTGSLILLVDFQTKDFMNASASGLSVKFGANPMPAACNGSADTTCGHHLDGTASFSIAAGSPTDALVSGKIVSGAFTGGPGDLTLQIAIGSTTPISLNLLRARARATGISETGITSITVGGLVTQEELTSQLGPAIQAQLAPLIDRDCPIATRVPPDCGCTPGSTGALVISLADGDLAGSVHDCAVTTEELLNAPLVKTVLQPDSCSKDTCTTADALSIGVQVKAVKATVRP